MRRVIGLCVIAFMVVCLAAGFSVADIQLNNLPEAVESVSIGGSTEQYYLAHQNAFGVKDEDYYWVDAMFKLHTVVQLKSGVEAKLGVVYAGTFGEDYYSSPYGLGALPVAYEGNNSSTFEADEAYIKFKKIAGAPVDVTLGKQRINIEKGFLMSEQDLSFDTNVYGNARKTSPFGVKIDIGLDPVAIQLYGASIDTGDDMATFLKGETVSVYGLNLNYAFSEKAYVYTGAINYRSETDNEFDSNDMTYYLGADLTFGGLNFQAEYAMQRGEDSFNEIDRDATAAMAFLKYTFESAPLMPFVEVGGWYLSGDDPDTDDNEAFNTMTVGLPDWGKWCPGEIFGEQIYFGISNYQTIALQVGISPTETTGLRLQYFQTSWIEKETVFGSVEVSDTDASTEFNLIFEWFPSENLYAGIIIGMATPGTGLEDLMGDDETATMIMPYLVYNF